MPGRAGLPGRLSGPGLIVAGPGPWVGCRARAGCGLPGRAGPGDQPGIMPGPGPVAVAVAVAGLIRAGAGDQPGPVAVCR